MSKKKSTKRAPVEVPEEDEIERPEIESNSRLSGEPTKVIPPRVEDANVKPLVEGTTFRTT